MKLRDTEALDRLAAMDHGVLCTVHPQRGVDAIPVVYVVASGHVGIPVDRVKPKASDRLQRERNLEADPRATLLVDHWDAHDWTRLWWVRAELSAETQGDHARQHTLRSRLTERFPQYDDPASIARVLTLRITRVTGWSGVRDSAP